MQQLIGELERRHGVRPMDGLQILAVDRLVDRPFDPGMALLILPSGAEGSSAVGAESTSSGATALLGRHGHGTDALALLRRLYPPDQPLLGLGEARDITLAEADERSLRTSPWVLPAVPAEASLGSPHALPWLVARLRAPDGCPWDREQDHLTLRPFLLEEAYEVYDALEAGSSPQLAEELGDLLLQIVLHAQYAAEAGVFDLSDVYRGIMAKIIRRHPHVFAEGQASTAAEVIREWERIKAAERGTKAGQREMPAAFAGLSRSLPALTYAAEMQGRAASLGYDWPDVEGVIDKVAEEAVELLGAADVGARAEEFGDLLFVLVNLGRKLGVDPEAALRAACNKFASRFARVERMAESDGIALRALGLDELDELWERAKTQERDEAGSAGSAA